MSSPVLGNPARSEKRYSLAQEAVALLHDDNVVLFPVFDRPHDDIVRYMCAADALLLTSVSEGSPNVIKEAMACNCPIMATDIADIRHLLGKIEGHYICTFDPNNVAMTLHDALGFKGRTKGRERIVELGLDNHKVAEQLMDIYAQAMRLK